MCLWVFAYEFMRDNRQPGSHPEEDLDGIGTAGRVQGAGDTGLDDLRRRDHGSYAATDPGCRFVADVPFDGVNPDGKVVFESAEFRGVVRIEEVELTDPHAEPVLPSGWKIVDRHGAGRLAEHHRPWKVDHFVVHRIGVATGPVPRTERVVPGCHPPPGITSPAS